MEHAIVKKWKEYSDFIDQENNKIDQSNRKRFEKLYKSFKCKRKFLWWEWETTHLPGAPIIWYEEDKKVKTMEDFLDWLNENNK